MDTESKQALSFATVSIYRVIDTSLVTYRLTNKQGAFNIKELPLNDSLKIVISHSGYESFRKVFYLTDEVINIDLNIIELDTSVNELEELIIFSEIPPVIIRNDTIEFNASSFKTLPNALLEDLLKKLPGVVVEKNGSIRVNGNRVNKIMVDGKDFFAGDLTIATKNLPANIIDKVQVTGDKEGKDFLPGESIGMGGQIINLKLKKGLHKGWFGKTYAGIGTSDHYEAGIILNAFADTTQISIIGYSNNINKPGFGLGDLQEIGGFARSGITSSSNHSNGLQVNNISFGGTGEGIQTSSGTGLNFNNEFKNKISVNLQYFYGTIKSEIKNNIYSQQTLGDTIYFNTSDRLAFSEISNNNFGFNFKYKPDHSSLLNYKFTFISSGNSLISERNISTSNNFKTFDAVSYYIDSLKLKKKGFFHEISLNKKLKKPGRAINFSGRLETSTSNKSLFNFSSVIFNNITQRDSTDQYRATKSETNRFNLYVSYSEPLSGKVQLRVSNELTNIEELETVDTYNKDYASNYNVLNPNYSNALERWGYKNTLRSNISLKMNDLTIVPGIGIQHIILKNSLISNSNYKKRFVFLLPQLNIHWNDVSLNYSAKGAEPELLYLNPVIDNTNPLYLRKGNLYLQPTYYHTFYLTYNKFDFTNSSTWIYYLDGNLHKNAILYKNTINENGVQSIMPFNTEYSWNIGASIAYSKRIRMAKKRTLNVRASLNPLLYKSDVSLNNIESKKTNISFTPKISAMFNSDDKIEVNSTYSYSYSNNSFSNNNLSNYNFLTHSFQSEVIIRMPEKFIWENSISMYMNRNSQKKELSTNIVIWNASVSYLFLPNEKAQLRLLVFDLLNNNVNIERNVLNNSYTEISTNILKRYFSLTFLVNLKNLRERKVGGRDSLLYF